MDKKKMLDLLSWITDRVRNNFYGDDEPVNSKLMMKDLQEEIEKEEE